MDAGLKKVLGRIGDFWKKLSTKLKVLLILVLVGAITAIAVISAVSSRTQYVLLYSNLSDSESGKIVSELQTKSVKYKLSGNDIYVDKSVADETRMTLAVDGYPETTLDYSIYSSGSTWTMTDSDKKTLYQYQTQNRLQDTIKTIPGVQNAIVTITQGNDDTYVLSSDEEPVTASVKLTLESGVTLTTKQVNGIVNIVRYSVSGLTADNVTVEDSDGNTLNGDDAGDSLSTTQYALRKSVESQIKSTLLPVLEKVYGTGNVEVVPAVTIDAATTSTKTTTYSSPNGNGQGVVSSVSESNTVSGTGLTSAASGTVGVNGAEPEYTTSSDTTSVVSGVTTQHDYSATYLYNQVEQQVEDNGGSIKDMTIAVMLNSDAPVVATADPNEVKATVAAAAGTTADKVTVQMTKFASASSASSGKGNSSGSSGALVLPNGQTLLWLVGAAAVAAVLVALLVIILLRRRKKAKKQAEAEAEAQRLLEEQKRLAEEKKKKKEVVLETNLEEVPQDPVKQQINDFADNKPELVAQLLRNWLKD